MIFNLQNENEADEFKNKSAFYLKNGHTVDLTKKKVTITSKQNSALHLLYSIIYNKLNDVGMDFEYFGLKGQVICTRHNQMTVKYQIWHPIMKALFDLDSTCLLYTSPSPRDS